MCQNQPLRILATSAPPNIAASAVDTGVKDFIPKFLHREDAGLKFISAP